MSALLRAIAHECLEFVREKSNNSATRVVMLTFGWTAQAIGVAAVVYAFVRNAQVHALELLRQQALMLGKPFDPSPLDHGVSMVSALFAGAGGFGVSGAIAVALRTRKGGEPGDAATNPPPGPQP